MDEFAQIAKNQGPLGVVVILVLAYFMKVLIPKLIESLEKLTGDFRAELVAQRKDFRDEMASERTAHASAVDKITTAIREAWKEDRPRAA